VSRHDWLILDRAPKRAAAQPSGGVHFTALPSRFAHLL
jgi:hypothetical protein